MEATSSHLDHQMLSWSDWKNIEFNPHTGMKILTIDLNLLTTWTRPTRHDLKHSFRVKSTSDHLDHQVFVRNEYGENSVVLGFFCDIP